ncbi:hypothetical protein S7711_01052 [Stachybotrys chartarum IBT 7711]|uniref:SGNH hydrolase-type esterase domain-containing protein n=1 Tax=Stachybotrys chartarum (strain CBS 109288 / IBT 7711) TaxID=1280523 RepID=A0A084B499_STACB|nr:hypothetical protein S7711_01052 [Stachybotrys chartarum IBT 7711]KFA54285.1 hypothetical protein S40293_04807 [Stachybotrys chartarum IBT 40293]KFA81556.1 hypothetical protein S40288_07770 [Stachybotrys chartarum IBT 40288]
MHRRLVLGAVGLSALFDGTAAHSPPAGTTSDPRHDSRSAAPIARAPGNMTSVLRYREVEAGEAVKSGTKLRLLPVGDSITVGFLSDSDGGDGDGYRRRLEDDLSGDEVVFAGTESSGSMNDGYYAAWNGRTIQWISDHVDESLEQRPNIILLAAGTNDMNPNPSVSREGNDPAEAADRLGGLIDKMVQECPDATILVAMIIGTCSEHQAPATTEFQQLIPGIVQERYDAGHHVLAVDFTTFRNSDLRDCIHPTNQGYTIMGDYWYSFLHRIPTDWIREPVGLDPDRPDSAGSTPGYDGTFVFMSGMMASFLLAL